MRMSKGMLFFVLSLVFLGIILALLFMWRPAGLTEFGISAEREIVRVEITGSGGDMVILEKKGEGEWTLNNEFRAKTPAVKSLIFTLQNMKLNRPVPLAEAMKHEDYLKHNGLRVDVIAASHWIRLPFFPGLVERQQAVRVFEIGQQGSEGVVMRLLGRKDLYWVQVPGDGSDLKRVFSAKPHHWRDPVVVGLGRNEIHEIRVEIPGRSEESFALRPMAEGGYGLIHANGEMVDKEKIDADKLERFTGFFAALYYEQLVRGGEEVVMEQLIEPEPFFLLHIQAVEGPPVSLEFFRRRHPLGEERNPLVDPFFDPDRFYLRINGEDFALARYFVFNRVMRPLSFFCNEGVR